MSPRGIRVGRGLAAAAIATFVAALFHVAGGGATPSALALTLGLTFSSLACIALAGRRMSLWRLTASVGVSQFLFHALLSLGAPAGGRFEGSTGHLHPGTHLLFTPGPDGTTAVSADGAMWLSHAAATVVTVVILCRGELAARSLLALTALAVGRLLRWPTRVLPTSALPRTVTAEPPTLPRPLLAVLSRLRHRGPPATAGTPAP